MNIQRCMILGVFLGVSVHGQDEEAKPYPLENIQTNSLVSLKISQPAETDQIQLDYIPLRLLETSETATNWTYSSSLSLKSSSRGLPGEESMIKLLKQRTGHSETAALDSGRESTTQPQRKMVRMNTGSIMKLWKDEKPRWSVSIAAGNPFVEEDWNSNRDISISYGRFSAGVHEDPQYEHGQIRVWYSIPW